MPQETLKISQAEIDANMATRTTSDASLVYGGATFSEGLLVPTPEQIEQISKSHAAKEAGSLATSSLVRPEGVGQTTSAETNEMDGRSVAAELSEKYGQPSAESQEYGVLLKKAAEGTLDFDPIENIIEFAKTVDQREVSTGVADVAIPVNTEAETDTTNLSESTMLKLTQQVRLARSLGFTTHGKLRIEDGQVKLRILAPGIDRTPAYYPVTAKGKVIDRAPIYDKKEGNEISGDAAENLLAAREFIYLESEGALPLESMVRALTQTDSDREVQLLVRIKDGFYLGGISFYRNIAESLGYIVGAPTKPKDDRLNAYYELPITGIRPGFGNNVEAPIRADANSEEGETIPQIDHEIMDFARHPEHFSAEQQAEMFKKAELQGRFQARPVVMEGADGVPYWGHEYPNIFTFNGNMRSDFDKVPRDFNKWTTGMQLGGEFAMLGRGNIVIFELDDGEKIAIKRTNDARSADLQEFELISSAMERGRHGQEPIKTKINSAELNQVVVVVGERLKLGLDPKTGKAKQTKGRVMKITTVQQNERGIVDPKHQDLETARIDAIQYASSIKLW